VNFTTTSESGGNADTATRRKTAIATLLQKQSILFMLLIAMSGGDMLKQDPGNIAAYPAVVPTAHDVLFGRNARCWNHEGNRKFRKIISRYQDDYHTTKSRSVKVAIVSKIAEELSLKGVRFLKQNPETKEWTVVDRDTVIEKVRPSFLPKIHQA
jgi:hypothetical protein